ncbi:unnamed protein product [Lactuca saligna]|uniref:Uncharacterized protein n=1 Tax=Lactuca saligna TaxID=75948 RepID=A0AA35UTQ2_LACSI|nr:unnamed protein product [Lactuca saligna]
MEAKAAAKQAQQDGAKAAKMATWQAKRIIGTIISSGWDFFEAIYYGGIVTERFLKGELPRNTTYPSANFSHDQHSEPQSRNHQDGLSVATTGTVSAAGYAGYYSSSYQQQQPNQSYPKQQPNLSSQMYVQPSQTYVQPAGAYQSTGAPHQPISSFQNAGSYPGPAIYSTTYYNPGDYQPSGGYQTANYNTQTNSWSQGSHPSYAHQYPNYTTDSNVAIRDLVLIASSVSEGDYRSVKDITYFVLTVIYNNGGIEYNGDGGWEDGQGYGGGWDNGRGSGGRGRRRGRGRGGYPGRGGGGYRGGAKRINSLQGFLRAVRLRLEHILERISLIFDAGNIEKPSLITNTLFIGGALAARSV